MSLVFWNWFPVVDYHARRAFFAFSASLGRKYTGALPRMADYIEKMAELTGNGPIFVYLRAILLLWII
jgi:hypothetical protein